MFEERLAQLRRSNRKRPFHRRAGPGYGLSLPFRIHLVGIEYRLAEESRDHSDILTTQSVQYMYSKVCRCGRVPGPCLARFVPSRRTWNPCLMRGQTGGLPCAYPVKISKIFSTATRSFLAHHSEARLSQPCLEDLRWTRSVRYADSRSIRQVPSCAIHCNSHGPPSDSPRAIESSRRGWSSPTVSPNLLPLDEMRRATRSPGKERSTDPLRQ